MDRTQRGWGIASLVFAGIGVAFYAFDPLAAEMGRHTGSTWVGLGLGSTALGIMVFCALLGMKRRVPHWRIGRAQTWLRGHIWFGLVSVWFVALHAAFAVGGTMTAWLWVLLALVTVSALCGVALQQAVPRLLMHSVQGETVAQQIGREIENLCKASSTICEEQESEGQAGPITRFYREYMAAYLNGDRGAALARPAKAASLFEGLKTMCPEEAHEGVRSLHEICDRYRELARQRTLMRVLVSWLIIHVPLSWGLLALAFVHAFSALRWSLPGLGGTS